MTTAVATSVIAGEVELLRTQAAAIHRILRRNLDGLSQEDTLIQPAPGGNCANWVVGHLVRTCELMLPVLNQQPVLGVEALKRYDRGSAELRNPAEAMPIEQLLSAWDEASARLDAGLAALTPEHLDERAPFSPRNNPDETVRSLLTIVMFHQAYHCGQTALHRRMAGKEGAIK
ncbi:MAG: DinB family protein [Acidobacteriaceae bacterium]